MPAPTILSLVSSACRSCQPAELHCLSPSLHTKHTTACTANSAAGPQKDSSFLFTAGTSAGFRNGSAISIHFGSLVMTEAAAAAGREKEKYCSKGEDGDGRRSQKERTTHSHHHHDNSITYNGHLFSPLTLTLIRAQILLFLSFYMRIVNSPGRKKPQSSQ